MARAHPDTPWPNDIASLGISPDAFQGWGPNAGKGHLPSDVTITPPDSSVPKTLAGFSGRWGGWMCHDRNSDILIAFESITSTEAKLAVGLISPRNFNIFPATATWDENGHQFRFERFDLYWKVRIREGGQVMEVMYDRGSAETFCYGVMRKS